MHANVAAVAGGVDSTASSAVADAVGLNVSSAVSVQERRIAWDGEAYTKAEFQQWYGAAGGTIWDSAVTESSRTSRRNPNLVPLQNYAWMRSCLNCGCYEPFQDLTDECCYVIRGEHCVFADTYLYPPRAAELRLLTALGPAEYAHRHRNDGWNMTDIFRQIEALRGGGAFLSRIGSTSNYTLHQRRTPNGV